MPATAAPWLQAALAAGRTVVVPGDPGSASTWREIGAEGATRAILAPSLGGMKVNGPRGPIRPVQPPSQLPNKPPPKPPGPPKGPGGPPKPPRGPGRPQIKPEAPCAGNEETVINQCVAFIARMTVEQIVVSVIVTIATIAGVALLGALAVGY